MKKLLLSLLISLCYFAAFCQGQIQNITVSGSVIDSANNQALSYVTASLYDVNSHLAVKSILSKEDGSFRLTAPLNKNYQLILTFVGYHQKIVAIALNSKIVELGKIAISSANKQLSAVSITAAKPLMKQEVDRLSYDVQADPESKMITALDMMRKVPLLSVDATDNIKLRGSGAYKILINGKESALMASNPSDILKAMPASNVLRIEVITTPPAKYDAEGLVGIINIITVKSGTQGYNGSINGSYNSIQGARVNINVMAKQGKLGYSGFAGTAEKPSLNSDFVNNSSFGNPVNSYILQHGKKYGGGTNAFNNNDLSYELDSLNLISATFNVFKNDSQPGREQYTTSLDQNQNITQAYHTINNGTANGNGSDFGLNYQLGFKRNKNELLTASYKYSNFTNEQVNNVTADQAINYYLPDFKQYNNSGSKEHTSQLDYILPEKVLTIEAGAKMILRSSYSNFHTDTLTAANQYHTNAGQTNDFTYHQDVYSAYNSYTLRFAKWTVKGGARLERTTINADFSSVGSNVAQDYINVVPSVSAQHPLTATSSLTFGFAQRIQRPNISQLNPFIDLSNPQFINVGNPALRPAINNNFELSYGNFAKGSINISAHYSFSNNTIQNITTVDANDITTTTYANVGQTKNLGADVSVNYPIIKKLNINVNAQLLQIWLRGAYNNTFYTNSGQQGHIFTFSSYNFGGGYRLGVNIGFDSRYVLLQGRDNWYFNNAYNASKELFKSKGSVFISVANPLSKYNKLDFFTKTPDSENYSYNYNSYRSIGFGFNYKFGKLTSAIKKNQRGINNDDAAGGR